MADQDFHEWLAENVAACMHYCSWRVAGRPHHHDLRVEDVGNAAHLHDIGLAMTELKNNKSTLIKVRPASVARTNHRSFVGGLRGAFARVHCSCFDRPTDHPTCVRRNQSQRIVILYPERTSLPEYCIYCRKHGQPEKERLRRWNLRPFVPTIIPRITYANTRTQTHTRMIHGAC
jgi:hypothetical protein